MSMILTCPNCATRFLVPDSAFGAKARRVRCGKCKHEWLADAPPPPPAPPLAVEENTTNVAGYLSMEDEKPKVEIPLSPPLDAPLPIPGGSNLPAPLANNKMLVRMVIVIALLLVVGVIGGIWLYATATGSPLFSTAAPAPQLAIEDVKTRYVEATPAADAPADPNDPKAWALVVEGTIRNKGKDAAALPPLILTMKDAQGTLLGMTKPDVQLQQLGAGEVTGFTATIADVSDKLAEVTVQFGAGEVATSPPTAGEGATAAPHEADQHEDAAGHGGN